MENMLLQCITAAGLAFCACAVAYLGISAVRRALARSPDEIYQAQQALGRKWEESGALALCRLQDTFR